MENLFRLVDQDQDLFSRKWTLVNGPVIVGAGPSGLAAAACLKEQGVPCVVLERADWVASLWQKRTYDRLKLHLPKQFCQLPKLPFPEDYPEYPTKKQFIQYLDSYANHFDVKPKFNESVESARYDETSGFWRVKTVVTSDSNRTEFEYVCRWLIVATGENAESVVPDIEGLSEFGVEVVHACEYKSGDKFKGKKVLVVGCGNSGMEVSLDLCNHNASPVHVLPREICGKSTFEIAVLMMKWLPLWLVDKLMLTLAWLVLGSADKYGLKRPSTGPLTLKNTQGKTPVLDIGAVTSMLSLESSVYHVDKLSLLMVSNLILIQLFWLLDTEAMFPHGFRKVNSSLKMDTQRNHFHMDGKGKLDHMQLGSQKEGYLVLPQMP